MSLLSSIRARLTGQSSRPEEARDPVRADNLFYTCDAAPIYYLSITKCGCTFVKHLLHRLDHGEDHPAGVHIHQDGLDLTRVAADDLDAVRASPYCFTVLRDPVQRFLSLYFDKIDGTGPTSFPQVREHLLARGVIEVAEPGDIERHQANARNFIAWLEDNLAGQTELGLNYHWRRQTSRLRRGRGFPLLSLTLDGLDWQLPRLVAPVLPDMAARMAEVGERNASVPPIERDAILDDALVGHVRNVYGQDWVNYEKAVAAWEPLAPETSAPDFANPPLIAHRRVRKISAAGIEHVSGAFLSGVERLEGEVVDLPQTRIGPSDIVLMQDPALRFVDAIAELAHDNRMPNPRFHRSRRRAWRSGQWPLTLEAPDDWRKLIATMLDMIERMPSLIRRHGLDPQYHAVQGAMAEGFHPVAGLHPIANFDQLHARAVNPKTEMGFDALTPDLVERIGNLYRADFELYAQVSGRQPGMRAP